jgi:hypothetical protein
MRHGPPTMRKRSPGGAPHLVPTKKETNLADQRRWLRSAANGLDGRFFQSHPPISRHSFWPHKWRMSLFLSPKPCGTGRRAHQGQGAGHPSQRMAPLAVPRGSPPPPRCHAMRYQEEGRLCVRLAEAVTKHEPLAYLYPHPVCPEPA